MSGLVYKRIKDGTKPMEEWNGIIEKLTEDLNKEDETIEWISFCKQHPEPMAVLHIMMTFGIPQSKATLLADKIINARELEWHSADIEEPVHRMPVMAMIRPGDDFDDDIGADEDETDNMTYNHGGEVPICGQCYDGGSYVCIQPFWLPCTGSVTFINFSRATRWRYISLDDAWETWCRRYEEIMEGFTNGL